MTMLPPSLPVFRRLPYDITIDGVSGYISGKIGQVDSELMMLIFVIRCLAETVFYQLANWMLKGKDLQSHKIFLTTSSVINLSFLIILRELNLIGRLCSCLLGLAVMGQLIRCVSYIQEKETSLIKVEKL